MVERQCQGWARPMRCLFRSDCGSRVSQTPRDPPRVVHDRRVGRLDGDHHLDRRLAPPVRKRSSYAGRFHNGPVGGRRAGRADDASEGGAIRRRCAAERPGDDRLAVLPPWRPAHGSDGGARSGLFVEPEIISKSFRLSKNPVDVRDRASLATRGATPGMAFPTSRRTRPVPRRVHEAVQPPREAVLGYRDTLYPGYRRNQEQLRASASVHRRLRRRRQLRPAPYPQ